VERTEPGWGRTAEPTPRWRSLLDRALLGRGGSDDDDYDGRFSEARMAEARAARGAPAYPADAAYRDGGYPDYTQRGYEEYPGRNGYGDYPEPEEYPPPRAAYAPATEYGAPADYARYPEPDYAEPQYAEPQYSEQQYGVPDSYVPAPRPANGFPSAGYPASMDWQPAAPISVDPVEEFGDLLRRELAGPHVLAFANPKGGVHKTTATVLAAATIGSVRGKGVIAWDDNELRGTLGLRAGSARHARTIRHLVRDLVDVESVAGYELRTRLDDYLRHASDGSYDVLAGEENPRFAQRLDPYTVKRVLELLRRTHDVICVDTGNNVESPNWQTVLQASDQLVVTTVPREDAAFTADWMLDLLDEAGMDDMVANAVTLLSCPSPNPTPLVDDLAAHFAGRTRAVVVVPYDPALESGSQIEYSDLLPQTRRAWMRAAAVLMDPYARG
jgi:MinD-like ATPase involved in chromosome partitioning or flagellar assembly